jgi:hypothetical protein
MAASLGLVRDKLLRQAQKHTGKRQSHKKKDSALGIDGREA